MATIYEYRTDIEYPEWMKSLPPEVEEGELRDPRIIWEEMQLDNLEHEREAARQEAEKPYKKAWDNLKRQRKAKGEKFDLSLDRFRQIKHQNCHFCAQEPGIGSIMVNEAPRDIPDMRVGKIDPKSIYDDTNVIPVCSTCSKKRQNKSVQAFFESEGGEQLPEEESRELLRRKRLLRELG